MYKCMNLLKVTLSIEIGQAKAILFAIEILISANFVRPVCRMSFL